MLKKQNLIMMAETRNEWCVSVYMPLGETSAKDKRRRLKKLMFDAELKLSRLETAPFQIARTLGPVEMILENAGFWENQTKGIAAFFTPESFAWYSLDYPFDELVVVTDRFHLKPMLRNTSENGRFYLLALSGTQIRLFEASETGINEVYVKGIPRNLACFLNPDEIEAASAAGDKHSRLADLFRRVDKAVAEFLRIEDVPLVLAGAEHLHPVYHDANSYPHILKTGIGGDADRFTPKQLLDKALPVIKPVFRRKRRKALQAFAEKLGTNRASNNLTKIMTAAKTGRIETLFVPVGRQKWGTLDKNSGQINVHERPEPGDMDLLCVASMRTLRRGGDVFVVRPEEMPNESLIAAVLRN
jgi:hypothetical protein